MPLALTLGVIGPTDVNRLRRELIALDDFFAQASARQAGASIVPPKTTSQLDDLAKLNKLNLLKAEDRAKLSKQLDDLLAKAPKLRISFAVDPPPKVLESILNWLRFNLDPRILLSVGLQPNIGAGCVLRTPNREFDLSMRQHLTESKQYLYTLIEQSAKKYLMAHPEPPPPPVPPPAQPAPRPNPPAQTPSPPSPPIAQPPGQPGGAQ